MAEINLDDGTINCQGEWLSKDDLSNNIKKKMEAGDMKISELASALEELNKAIENSYKLDIKIVTTKDEYEKLKALGGDDDKECVRKAVMAFIIDGAASETVQADMGIPMETKDVSEEKTAEPQGDTEEAAKEIQVVSVEAAEEPQMISIETTEKTQESDEEITDTSKEPEVEPMSSWAVETVDLEKEAQPETVGESSVTSDDEVGEIKAESAASWAEETVDLSQMKEDGPKGVWAQDTIEVKYDEKKEAGAGKETAPEPAASDAGQEKTVAIKCPKCKFFINVSLDNKPTLVECPECGTSARLSSKRGWAKI